MRVIRCNDYGEMSGKAAAIIAAQLTVKRDSVLGLATGSTPVGLYRELIRAHERNLVDFSECVTFNLDEYRDLEPSNPNSYHAFMREKLFGRANFREENTHLPDGTAEPEAACAAYEAAIDRAGGVDIQVLGIGNNGHIGFNEPADHFPAETHIVELAEETRRANARFFGGRAEAVPKRAITMGIGTIMRSRQILLLASGADKAEIVRRMLYGPVTPGVPASVLQFHHNAFVFVDREAASRI